MFAHLYQKYVINKPRAILLLLLVALLSFGYFSKDFRLDASSETLLIEGDPDLKYLREINERYGSKDFLILTVTPKEKISSQSSINNLLSLKYKIQSLDWVHSVITLLDIPLLNNSDKPITERIKNYSTLKDENVDKERGFEEILNSPVFRNFVISEDGKTTGIIVNIKKHDELKNIQNKSKKEIEKYKDLIKKKNHKNIVEIRKIISAYGDVGNIFLGGIPMIADDMMSFIKNDIIVFGVGVLLFIIATLWFVFRKLIWIIIPLSSCFFSVVIMTGILGLLNWKVTVISSNFIALMLILTMAMNIHISTRFLQLKKNKPNSKTSEIILETMHKMFWPIIYTVLTTICAFLSLIFSEIKPIIDFGWMMTLGLTTSFIITFTLLPTLLNFFSSEKTNINDKSKKTERYAKAYGSKEVKTIWGGTKTVLDSAIMTLEIRTLAEYMYLTNHENAGGAPGIYGTQGSQSNTQRGKPCFGGDDVLGNNLKLAGYVQTMDPILICSQEPAFNNLVYITRADEEFVNSIYNTTNVAVGDSIMPDWSLCGCDADDIFFQFGWGKKKDDDLPN